LKLDELRDETIHALAKDSGGSVIAERLSKFDKRRGKSGVHVLIRLGRKRAILPEARQVGDHALCDPCTQALVALGRLYRCLERVNEPVKILYEETLP
jgi:hypothetical protein